MFGVLSMHRTMISFCTPWQYVLSYLRPLFARKILDRYGHVRSRRRASARLGEAPLVRNGIVHRVALSFLLNAGN